MDGGWEAAADAADAAAAAAAAAGGNVGGAATAALDTRAAGSLEAAGRGGLEAVALRPGVVVALDHLALELTLLDAPLLGRIQRLLEAWAVRSPATDDNPPPPQAAREHPAASDTGSHAVVTLAPPHREHPAASDRGGDGRGGSAGAGAQHATATPTPTPAQQRASSDYSRFDSIGDSDSSNG